MRDIEKIKEKIKALLSKTVANGCTEAEMMSALAMAQAMMDAHEITDADIREAKDEAAMQHTEAPETTDSHNIKWQLCHAVGKFCNVQLYRQRSKTLAAIGMKSDVDQAMWLLDTIADFVFEELYRHLIDDLSPPGERRTVTRVFVEACCWRISDRLRELVSQTEAARTSNGRELVVVKGAAIKAYMKDHDIHLRMCSGGGGRNDNEGARAAGRAAGERASFGRPVSGAGGTLRLGR
jgi:hypothetical protein